MTASVIFIDDEEHLRTACCQALELADFSVESLASSAGALDGVGLDWPGVIVTDVRMPGTTGLELMAAALDRDPELPVILITGHGDVAMAVQAMRDGAYDFIEKPFASETLVETVRRAADKRHLTLENRRLRSALDGGARLERVIVGTTPAAAALRAEVTNFASMDADVLIVGETGTGKELVARALHENSGRAARRFVPVNCAALPESLIESELFGHVRGAFTGADSNRIGRFEHADGGTLFLDEIESMPLDLQTRLLRVLEDRKVVPVGSNDERPVDIRVVAATKSDLRELAAAAQFRDDLYYRLNVLAIEIPPLRERLDDIPALLTHFVDQAASRFKREPPALDTIDLAGLMAHDWPGNVRELKNAAMRIALGQNIGLPQSAAPGAPGGAVPETLPEQVGRFERELIRAAVARNGGKLKPTYEQLGISRKTLYEKIKKYGLDVGQAAED